MKGFPLKIVLNQERDSFVLITDDASRDCRVHVIEAELNLENTHTGQLPNRVVMPMVNNDAYTRHMKYCKESIKLKTF